LVSNFWGSVHSGGFFYAQRELGVLATKQKCLVIQLLGLGVITSAQMKLS